MSGSVGVTKIPLVSTFDPAGVNAAKAGLKELQQSQGGANGGGGGGGAKPPAQGAGLGKLPGMPELKSFASELGLKGPIDMLSKFATPAAGAAAAATGLFVAFQKSAMQARELRIESQKLGVGVGMYRDLAFNARMAGVSLGDVTAGMEKVNAKASEAMSGGIGAQAYFAGLGVSPGQLAGMQGDPAEIAKIVAQRGNTAQQIQMFGSVDAAKAVAKSSNDSGHGRAANDALEATNLHLLEHPIDTLKDVSHSFLSGIAYYTQRAGRAYGGGMSFGQAGAEMDSEAAGKEAKERLDRTITARKEAGTKQGEGMLTVAETNAAQAKSEATFNYSDISALTGVSADTFRSRAETQRMQKQQGFNSQYQNAYEKQDANRAIIDRQQQEGTLTGTQAYRAGWSNWNQTAAAVSGTRSNAENLRNAMTSFGGAFNDPGGKEAITDAESRLKRAKEDNENTHFYGSEFKPEWAGKRKESEAGVAAAQANLANAQGAQKQVQTDAARDFGDKLTDYVQNLTSAGPQTGAYGVNTVQGASQLMGAEYQMDQSQDTRRMVEVLLKIAENTGHLKPAERQAVADQLGFRNNGDPISQLFGGGS